jgi:exosome complex exonuclease RRP6
MDITSDFQGYHDRVTKSLIEVVRTGGQISNADLGFHRSSGEVSRALDQQNARLLRLTNKLLKAASQDSNVKPPTLRDKDEIDDNWRDVVEVVDNLLEKADASLDEFTGVIRRSSPALQDGAQTPSKQQPQPPRPNNRFHFPKVLHKPQLLFHNKINNLEPKPFKPLLVEKPHAIKTLEDSIGDGPEQLVQKQHLQWIF